MYCICRLPRVRSNAVRHSVSCCIYTISYVIFSRTHTRALCGSVVVIALVQLTRWAVCREPSTWPNWNVEDFVPAPPRLQTIFTSHVARGPIITQPPPYTSKLYLYSAVCGRLYILLYVYTRPNWVAHRLWLAVMGRCDENGE